MTHINEVFFFKEKETLLLKAEQLRNAFNIKKRVRLNNLNRWKCILQNTCEKKMWKGQDLNFTVQKVMFTIIKTQWNEYVLWKQQFLANS